VSSYDGLTSINVKNVSEVSKKDVLKSTTCISKTKFSNIKNVLKQAKEKIWKNWDIENFPLFLTVFNIPKKSWNIQKHKFVKLIIESFDSRNSSFIAGFSG
jgi:effector-binding domain-containing protein